MALVQLNFIVSDKKMNNTAYIKGQIYSRILKQYSKKLRKDLAIKEIDSTYKVYLFLSKIKQIPIEINREL